MKSGYEDSPKDTLFVAIVKLFAECNSISDDSIDICVFLFTLLPIGDDIWLLRARILD